MPDTFSLDGSRDGERLEEEYYGFYVENRGRRIAEGVRFQILAIEYRTRKETTFSVASSSTFDLFTYTGADGARGSPSATIVPGALAQVALGWWRQDRNVVVPATNAALDYYEEILSDAVEYRFKVVAFDKKRYVKSTLTVRTPMGRKWGPPEAGT